jgi:hypothetical protein
MGVDPRLLDDLVWATASARWLRGKRIYPDTLQYWHGVLDRAREAQRSGQASHHLETLTEELEAELAKHSAPWMKPPQERASEKELLKKVATAEPAEKPVTVRESELDMVLRYVREGEEILDRYRKAVAEMEAAGQSACEARGLIASFERTMAHNRERIVTLQARQSSNL